MKCPFKLEYIDEEHNGDAMSKKVMKWYYYQECCGPGCQAWSLALNDCRLALMGMERVTQKSNGGGE